MASPEHYLNQQTGGTPVTHVPEPPDDDKDKSLLTFTGRVIKFTTGLLVILVCGMVTVGGTYVALRIVLRAVSLVAEALGV